MKYEQGSSDVVDLLVINYIIVCHFLRYCVEFTLICTRALAPT